VFPIHGVIPGEPWYIHPPDTPPVKDGRQRKYLIPAGRKMALDDHPHVREGLANPTFPLFVTEGAKKVDALVTAEARAVRLRKLQPFGVDHARQVLSGSRRSRASRGSR
jgi:hypothetical protein